MQRVNQNELAAIGLGKPQVEKRLITIQEVNNGYILSAGDGSINVVESGNEVDMVLALQKFFGFIVFATEEGGASQETLEPSESTV